jgi:hypothetical protein
MNNIKTLSKDKNVIDISNINKNNYIDVNYFYENDNTKKWIKLLII